jgi:hypothetical protein
MGVPVLILGESGSGKTYSIKNLDPETTGLFLVEKGILPFRKRFPNTVKNANYGKIIASLKLHNLPRYVIDDSQYLMANEFFDRANETGYQKFTDIGVHFRDLIHLVNRQTPDNVIVYFLHHTELDTNTGRTKAKTIGKMLDEKLTVEGCFDIVLYCKDQKFYTQGDSISVAKSPEGMFQSVEIPNDLKAVNDTIREYYGITVDKKPKNKEEK